VAFGGGPDALDALRGHQDGRGIARRGVVDDVVEIESRTKIYDKNDVAYPPLAKTLWDRQNNLKRTIADLQRRLPETPAAAMETAA